MVKHWLFSINVLILLLSTSTGVPNLGTLSSEKSPAQNFTNNLWYIQSVIAPSPYTAQIFFFMFQFCFFLSWNNKAHYTENVAYFLPLSILKWLHKNSPTLKFFFNCMLTGQMSQYNLTKLLQMKLKTTKHYKAILEKKTNFLANPI